MSEDIDKTLVRRILAGDREAYRGIVDRHKARIYFLGLKFFHRAENAEDFTQEVFVRAYEKLGTFRGASPFSPWLYRLAFNLAVNQYHIKRRQLSTVKLEETLLKDDDTSPEEHVVREEEKKNINKILNDLPDVYNVIIKMHYYDGLTYKQIAASMKIPVNTVKSHIHRAKIIIKRKLARTLER